MTHTDNAEQNGGSDEDPSSAPPRKAGIWGRVKQRFATKKTEAAKGDEVEKPFENKLGIGNLRALRVEDVCVPKADIVSVPASISKQDLLAEFRNSGLTRLPVYDGTLDTPLGFVHMKDLALKHGFNAGGGRLKLKDMLRPLLFAPPSMPIGVLLAKMQADRIHMALVIDEYGGTDGLVTIEDLIEQVIGEIEDEHDIAEGKYWVVEKPNLYRAQAKTPLEDFQAEIDMNLLESDEIDSEDIDSLGGLVSMLSGRVPARGEMIKHPLGLEFEVIEADPRRIKVLRVHVPANARGKGA